MNVVVVGGGHGAPVSLKAAQSYAQEVAGIITVADDGGSSGRLAQELGVLPMGDIRNCLAALAPPSPLVEVFQHRFADGPQEGHVIGNLFMAAAQQETGSFIDAIRIAARMLGSRGRVVPPTLDKVKLVAEIEGERVEGQAAVSASSGRISYVTLDPPDPAAYPEAVHLLEAADQVVLGPGSFFTSVIPSLVVPGVRDAFRSSPAQKVLVCNLTKPAETQRYDAAAYVAAVFAQVGDQCVDVLVAHEGVAPNSEAPLVEVDTASVESMGVKVVLADLVPDDRTPVHDPAKLGAVLSAL